MMNKRKSHRTCPKSGRFSNSLSLVAAFACTIMGGITHAAVDVSNIPLKMAETPAPNIWFILDDSGSMEWLAMPDDRTSLQDRPTHRGSAVNTIYYNPMVRYRGWKQANGKYMDDRPATSAYSDESLASGGTIDLTQSNQIFYVLNSGATDLTTESSYKRYVLRSGGAVAEECAWTGSWSCNSISTFPWGTTISEEWQNYANWYSYHRTRMKVAKAGASEAFAELGENYRVGFTTIRNRNTFRIPVANENGLFKGDNRRTWFSRLASAEGSGRTPLIPALERAGEYFSEEGASGPYGPESGKKQLACRQNFSILTTDGYWNEGSTSVGNADGTAGLPITGPNQQSYAYQPVDPYRDDWNNTLADVAMHYWKRDLRSDLENIVPSSAANPAFWQHMVTFGISIGLKGTLDQGSVREVLNEGTTINGISVDWPQPTADSRETIDDLLHAAVNGRGEFVAASNPEEFVKSLQDALAAIVNSAASRSSVSANSTALRAGTSLYQASYVGGEWSGSLKAFPVENGSLSDTPAWEASVLYSNRKVYTEAPGASTPATRRTNFPNSAQAAYLNDVAIDGSTGTHVTDYIRGQQHYEQPEGPFRKRTSLLGDIVYSSPVYIEGPRLTAGQGGKNTVFIGANDGMLHAFDASNGSERFAYVPGGLNLDHLRAYADLDYPHYFSVDGPIVVSTRQQTPDKNILVGALGRGGKGLFALDVTNPDDPKVLWDHTWSDVAGGTLDARGTSGWDEGDKAYMAHIVNAPFITQLDDDNRTPVVITSGGLHLARTYAAGEVDQAALFVINLETGDIIRRIRVPETFTDGNSLSAPRGWDSDRNGTADVVYAGDLQGNIWKFDPNNNYSTSGKNSNPVRMFTAMDADGKRQPITGGLTVAVNPSTYERMVLFGTGRFLTEDDPTDLSIQSLYGLIDRAENKHLPIVRSSDLTQRRIVTQTTASGRVVRTFEPTGSELEKGKDKGWYIDLVVNDQIDGERVIGQARNEAGVLLVNSGIPSADPCNPTGSGFTYALDAFTGASLGSAYFDLNDDGSFDDDDTINGTVPGAIGHDNMLTDSLTLMDGDGTGKLISGDHGAQTTETGIKGNIQAGRISWREIMGN